ncbi:UbiH/UbiF/VisC/COQ6 family ubiquinone biosynthesis hydroxylase [Marinobacter xestospongiae]|uniref:UbiH/UbiF/VisC/COQ6 family ubiquinone biosynthesis hydroxylase n=1 Tax=Marinobacter xestospongiae TaxID=994319 RepID=UPI002003C307|nr:UbiH/UbiF/VisC/COQ6 family ubiquinone biosynthesis hydroxylase [Marinobacter xestospongiae]MCK7568365.1 UbiH/UbiF/VisC/COQ6 family ubiquinone biosynthesis hydroxylase [Marinobacter xestospongiae]
MNDSPHFDVLVAGGGMTGSALALGLGQQGWRVGVVEAAPVAALLDAPAPIGSVADFEPRVSAISAASQRLLADLGAWQAVATQRHCPYRGMTVWDAEGTGRIHFDATDLQVPALGCIVENRLLVRALMLALQDSPVTVFDQARVTGLSPCQQGQRQLTLDDGRELTASLVVAADGAQSRLRQWAGLPTREWDYDQQAIVCTVETTQSHRDTAWQRFSTTGPLAFLPLASGDPADAGRFCSIVWSQDTDEARRLLALSDNDFREALAAAIEHQLGPLVAVSARQAFPLRQRHAKDYIGESLALVGDAAHTIHPLAGQGVNLGYGDVRVLLAELESARQRGLSPADELTLARYQRRRKGDNLAMMAAMEGFKQLFARDELPLRWLRNAGMRWLDQLPAIKHRVAAQAMGLQP